MNLPVRPAFEARTTKPKRHFRGGEGMPARAVRISLVLAALALALTVPQILVAHVTMESRELPLRDEFVLLQARMPPADWALGGLPGYLLWAVAMTVPAAWAFLPRLRRFAAAAAGLLLGVAAVAGAPPKAMVAVALLLAATLLPDDLPLGRASPGPTG